ncbi:hypothetical protein [Desulfopila aestuarii]|uniref:Uncharacterized protein n=1 Tax=Desulfopila aestuarii DSM 18488 TaxID=1121416 RepID=A0A1M7YHM2_9BACT|nr:hypothetical protein [Desulfopila aestuarii]SHO52122.1 hypothetical protein SAMN02745220_04380 [Desulfopila aestuarii DSM 18488]
MKKRLNCHTSRLLCCLLAGLVISAGAHRSSWAADPASKTLQKFAHDAIVGGEGADTLIRYGNWFGPGWWGGSTLDDRSGVLPPVDSLDEVAQKHDFGYMLAEKLGKGRPDVEAYYKGVADEIAAREAKALSDDPAQWARPAPDPAAAKVYLERIRLGFPYGQQRLNELKALIPHRADITDLDTLNQMLDGYPDEKQYEALMSAEVKGWWKKYENHPKVVAERERQRRELDKNVKDLTTSKDYMQRIRELNNTKMQAVFKKLGIYPSLDFFHCLCRSAGYGSPGTSQLYHPDTIGEYNPKYSCNHPGDPCVVAGAGCTRHPLPTESKIWDSCMSIHRVGMDRDAKDKPIPGTGVRLDKVIVDALREKRR